MRAERERAAALAADCERRIAERDGEVEGLEQKAATYEEGLRAPFAGVRMRAEERVEGAEDAVLEILAGHLASNGVEVEGTGEGEPYDAALERAYRAEWDLLDAWMDGYRAGLASKLTHASRSLESELVWLEGHAPFGRRHWALAHEVADVMEREGCDASAALERVLEGDAGRDGDGSDAM